MVARQDGVVAGLDVAALAFRLIDPAIVFVERRPDGARVAPGETVARVEGPARGVLTAERVALNFLSRLSGVATRDRFARRRGRGDQGAHRLHAQDDAAVARDSRNTRCARAAAPTIASASTTPR